MKKTLKRISALALAVMLVLTLFAGCGGSSEGKKLKLGFDASFPPMGFKDGKNYVGFDIDMANEAVKLIDGYDGIELVPLDWDSKDSELSSGNIDMIWNGFTMHVKGRDEQYTWSEPYMKNNQVVVVKKDSSISSIADLAGKTVGVQKDSSGLAAVEDTPEVKATFKDLVQIGDYESALLELESGSIDAVVMDEVVIQYKISNGKDNVKILDASLAQEEYGVAFLKGNTELRDKVQKALDTMTENGKTAEISTKWFGKDITTLGK